jgi:hypothetical protein
MNKIEIIKARMLGEKYLKKEVFRQLEKFFGQRKEIYIEKQQIVKILKDMGLFKSEIDSLINEKECEE